VKILTDLEALMSQRRARALRSTIFFTDYADAAGTSSEFVIPSDLSTLTDEALAALHAEAVGHFDSIYGDGQNLNTEQLDALSTLTEGIEALSNELSARRELATERASRAAELATRVHTEERRETIEDHEDDTPAAAAGMGDAPGEDEEDGGQGGEGGGAPAQPTAVVADGSRPRDIRVNLGSLPRRTAGLPRQNDRRAAPTSMRDLVFAAGDGTGFAAGQGVDWTDVGRIIDRRLAGFNEGAYKAAAAQGRHMQQQFGVVTLTKPIPQELMIQAPGDAEHVDEIMSRAADESRLDGGSLVAAGGWCAPSEVLYDFLELESRDGLVSLPEVGVTRGGIKFTTGIDYSAIYTAVGFSYTETQDQSGTYAVDGTDLHAGTGGAGNKPCYTVPCPSFVDVRLGTAGLCISAGLLQQRGYPEIIARTTRGALVAHDHKMSIRKINAIVSGSTAVTMGTGSVGTAAPLLTAIEQQTEHYRYVQRLARGTTLEAIFPYWVRGAIRSDLALRAGLEPQQAFEITDAQIDGWFRSRGIAPQYVYDWQPLTGTAAAMNAWPSTVTFLLYVAGTWVVGASDVITLDTIYDSTLLGQNNFTALFTEEGYLVAKRGIDSRAITVPICVNGATGGPIVLACDGTNSIAGGDTTGPVAGTLASSAITTTGFTLTVTGASDAGQGLHGLPYRFTTDGGSTWSAWQASNVFVVTGKTTATTYQTRHQVRDINNNTSTGNALPVTTA
jgi:hypothetical protein